MKAIIYNDYKVEGEPLEIALFTEIITEYLLKRAERSKTVAKEPEYNTPVSSDEQSVIDMINEALDEFKRNGGLQDET